MFHRYQPKRKQTLPILSQKQPKTNALPRPELFQVNMLQPLSQLIKFFQPVARAFERATKDKTENTLSGFPVPIVEVPEVPVEILRRSTGCVGFRLGVCQD